MKSRTLVLVAVIVCLGIGANAQTANVTLVPAGAVWRYLDNGSDQGTAWRAASFDHTTWSSGRAQLGYGDGDEVTVVSYGPNASFKYITTYFRHAFNVPDASSITGLTVRLLRDDGGVVYLNGVEVFRSNMGNTNSFVSYLTPAASAIPNSDETVFFPAPVNPLLLVNGTNVVAVEIHQANGTSSDMSFDLQMIATVPTGPPVIVQQPRSQTVTSVDSAIFSVKAAGGQPLSYAWYLNGQEILEATNATLRGTELGVNAAGPIYVVVTNSFGSVTSAPVTLNVVSLTGDFFQITRITTNNPVVREHSQVTGDDRGGIAASFNDLFITGDAATARFNLPGLDGGTSLGKIHDSLVSDLRSGRVYLLANGTNAAISGSINSLLEVDGTSGIVTTNRVMLSTNIDVNSCFGCVGIFAGFGRVVLHTGSRAYAILLPSGVVQDLGSMSLPQHQYSENWAYWGVAEFFEGSHWMVYVRDAQTIVRTRVPDGLTLPVGTFQNLSDMASLTVAAPLNRWYFHHQHTSQFRSGTETAGSADAFFAHEQQPQPPAILAQPRDRTVAPGSDATMSVMALGFPLRYQWQFNGQSIINATNATLNLIGVSAADVGLYTVVVSNDLGSITSAPALLNVVSGGNVVSRVAVFGADPANYLEDVRQKIQANGLFEQVDAFQAWNGLPVPTLQQLQEYDAVLVFSDGSFTDPIAFGNALADYVDGGGGVVLATFAVSATGMGRLSSGGYSPFIGGFGNSGGPLTLLPDIAGHPLLEGVGSFNGGSSSFRLSGLSLTSEAELVAHWSNGEPVAGVKAWGDASVVGLNFFPVSSTVQSGFWDARTDGGRLIANALSLAGRAGGETVPGVAAGIKVPPQDLNSLQGLDATLEVIAYGSPSLAYQWLYNFTPISDATNRVLTLTNVQTNQAGLYSVAVSNTHGAVTSQVASLTVLPTRGMVGYFSDFNTASTGLAQSIVRAQFTPVRIQDIGSFDLSRLNVLMLNETSDHPSAELRGRLPDIQDWVYNGGRLIVHQRFFNNEALSANPLLVGARGVAFTNICCLADVNLASVNNLIVNGPHGSLNSTSFDAGEQYYAAAAQRTTLPPGASTLFTAGPSASQVVAFAYGMGSGLVYHSTLWLDWYADNSTTPVGDIMRNIYAPNLIEYAVAYTPSGVPRIVAAPESHTATLGSGTRFFVSATGQAPLQYQWFFNGAPLPDGTNNPLVLPNVSNTNAGSYSVTASNSLGSATSIAATLKVVPRINVAVYRNPRYVYTGFNTPADNAQTMLEQLGHTVLPITNLLSALTNDVLLMPPAGPRVLLGDLDQNSRSLLQSYVAQGGMVIALGSYDTAGLLSSVFDLPFGVNGCYSGMEFYRTPGLAAPVFADLPPTIYGNSCVYPAYSSPPASLSLYTNQFYGNAATLFPYGAGTLVYLAWSWNDALPAGQQDGGWSTVLAAAILSKGVVTGWPSTAPPLVSAGSVWRYLDDGSDQGTAWRGTNYNDSSWLLGAAQFGYGDGDESTVVNYGPDPNNKLVTTYFRHAFVATNVSAVSSLEMRLLRDDGAAVYLNGTEIARNCLLPFAAFNSYAICTISDAVENEWISYPLNPGLLQEGTNYIAVEVHQVNATSTDISFDLELTSVISPTTPVIRVQPVGHSVSVGASVVLHVLAGGALPMNYQWRINGQNIPAATNALLFLNGLGTNDSGNYSVIVSNAVGWVASDNALVSVITLGGDTFRIATLSSNNAAVVDVAPFAGDDRGGIAASAQRLFYTGDDGTALFNLGDLSGGTNIGYWHDAIVSDLATERVYSLATGTNAGNVLAPEGGVVTALLEVDGITGLFTGSSIQLSQPIDLNNRYGQVGLFAGHGRIAVHDGTLAWNIDVPSGLVVELGATSLPQHNDSENWAIWGVAEFFEGEVWLVYVRDSEAIVRTRASDGLTSTVATFENLSDMASITVSLPLNRWYFHHQSDSQFSTFYETAGYAEAAFVSSAPGIAPTIVTHPADITIAANSTAILRVAARGTGPLSYQWSYEGQPLPQATNSVLILTGLTTNQSGRYSVVVSNVLGRASSSGALLTVVRLRGEAFKIASLSTNAEVADVLVAGYDRGGIAVSSEKVFHTGNSGTALFALSDLSGGTNSGYLVDGLISDLATETVYGLGDGTNLIGASGAPITSLIVLDSITGQPTGTIIPLSQPVTLRNNYGQVGLFSGLGRMVLTDGSLAWSIEPATGLVLNLGPVNIPDHNSAPVGTYWGVVEFFDSSLWLVHVRDSRTIVRTRLPDGLTETVARFTDVSDMASITVSVPLNRWYFHHQNPSQFSSYYGTVGFAKATFTTAPVIAPSILQSPGNQTVGAGGTAVFRAVARGSAPLEYQWLFESSIIPGATNESLTLTNVSVGQAGLYSVVANNSVGSITSAPASLRVMTPVTVAVFNDFQYVFTNEFGHANYMRKSLEHLGHRSTSFTNIPQASAGSAPLLFPSMDAGDLASALTAPVRTALQNYVSRGGVLIVNGTANDYSRPTRFLNALFDFNLLSDFVWTPSFRTVQAAGAAFADDPAAISANDATFGLLSGVLPAGTRRLYVAADERTTVASIPFGSGRVIFLGWNWNNAMPLGQQNGGWLTVLGSVIEETQPSAGRAPEILVQPRNRIAISGTSVRFQTAATGSPFTYRWTFNGQPLPGATNYLLQLNTVTANNAGDYTVVVSNAFGSVTSSVARLDVVPPVTVGVFDDPRFVNTSGGPNAPSDNLQASLVRLGHRVQTFTNIARATTNQVLVFPVFDQGDFVSSLDQSNRLALQLFTQQGGMVICHGGYNNVYFLNSVFGLSLSYSGFGGGPFVLTEQAYGTPFGSGPLVLPYNGDIFSLYSYTLPLFGTRNLYTGFNADYMTAAAQIHYGNGNIIYLGWNWVNAFPAGTQDGGWVETLGNAVLTRVVPATAPPEFTVQPLSQNVLAGSEVHFTIGGYGSPPLGVQWYFNAQPLANATNARLVLTFVETNQSGNYFAVLSNSSGSVTSELAMLTVRPTRGLIGYYTDYSSGDSGPAHPIALAGFTPLPISNIADYDISQLDMLLINESSVWPSRDLINRLPSIEAWINVGGKLIVHDRSAASAGRLTPLLPGVSGTILVNSGGDNLTVVPPGDSLVTRGPHGSLNDASLDGGNSSYHGYALRDTLPSRALPILAGDTDTNAVVAFSYALGAGSVYYAAIPLDYLLQACCSDVWTRFKNVYTPNVIEHAATFAVEGAPALLAQPQNTAALTGGSATLRAGANGGGPLSYQWYFNDIALPGVTNFALSFSGITANQAGTYFVVVSNPLGVVTSAVAVLSVIQPTPFRIVSLNASGAAVVEHDTITGDDRGGIGISSTHVYYTGDGASGRFSATNLSGGTSVPQPLQALVSDLRTETLYHLANEADLVSGAGATVTSLIEINGSTGIKTTNRIDLSTTIQLGQDTGIFAAYGAVVLHTEGRVYRIEVPSGVVLDVGPLPSLQHASCENWAYWGVAEFFGGSIHLVYVRDSQTIARTSVRNGTSSTVSAFSNLSDMCSFTVSIPRSRWYFHYEGTSQFGGSAETIGYASASFDRPPRFLTALTNVVIDEDSIAGPIPFTIADSETSSSFLLLAAESSNPDLLPSENIVFGATNLSRTMTLVPVPDQFGVSVVTITVLDGIGLSTNQTFILTVNPVNDSPLAYDSNYITEEDVTLDVIAPGLLANADDADPDTTLTAILERRPTIGTLTLDPDGAFRYKPASGFNGSDSFSYRVSDGSATSEVATATILVMPVNDAPVAQTDAFMTDEDTPLSVTTPGVLANDSDAEGDALTVLLVTAPLHGVLSLETNGSFTFSPSANYNGLDSFVYRASDGLLQSGETTVMIAINSVNDAPVLAAIDAREAVEGGVFVFTATATDVEVPAQQSLTYSLEDAPAGAVINPLTGEFSWTPGAGLVGTTNVFTVRVTDNGTPSLSDSQVVSVVVSAMPTISIADISVPGGSSGTRIAAFEVTLSAPPVYPVWVDFATTNGTAVADEDYTATNGTLYFPVNTTNQTIQVLVTGRPDYHVVRDFFINLTNATNAVLGDSQAQGIILDEPATGVVVEDVVVAEGSRGKTIATFAVNLTEASDQLVTLRYAISNGTATAAKDFRRKKGTVSFPPGVTTQLVQVPVVGDSLNEDDEFFTIHFDTPMNAVLRTGHATCTIMDDDPLPSLDFTRPEFSGTKTIPFLVRLSARSGRTVSVNFATEDGTAIAGTDYTPTNGTLTFLPGTRSQRVNVPVNRPGDRNERTFFLNLDTPVNATLTEPQASGHIKKWR